MAKTRVHELAKQLSLTSKELIDKLVKLNIDVKTHMSVISEEDLKKFHDHTDKDKKETQTPQVKPAAEPAQKPIQIEEAAAKTKPVVPEPPVIAEPKEEQKEEAAPEKEEPKPEKPSRGKKTIAEEEKLIEIPSLITVGELAKLIKTEAHEIIKRLLGQGILLTINQNLDFKKAEEIAAEAGFLAVKREQASEAVKESFTNAPSAKLVVRPPVVTVLGHVDHGKTTLLDAIRKTNVAESEAGGITQRIGASSIEIKGKKIIIIDTPGHEAFTSMRARGAKVTDIAILIVAADDGIMPQTIEAINHAKAAKVPIIVAINKIDLPQANPEKVKQQLTDYELLPEDWGGDTICVNVSAKQKIGLEELLDMILLVAEMHEIKADPLGEPRAIIIETKIDKGLGPVATVIIQNGSLKIGDSILAGTAFGKIRAIINDHSERTNIATPSAPAEIIGFTTMPSAGDLIEVLRDEKAARAIFEERSAKLKEEKTAKQHSSLDDLYKQITSGAFKELNLIIKADGQGSIEALRHSLLNIKSNEVGIKIIHSAVGSITESDIMLAAASDAIIIGFNVKPDTLIKKLAETENIDVRLYKVIYNVIEDIKAALTGMLTPEYEEIMLGQATVKQIFKTSKFGIISGCNVTEGTIKRGAKARITRGKETIYEGKITSLKRFKDDVKEVSSGYECGISVEKFGGIQPGDVIEAYEMQEKKRRGLVLQNEPANQ